VLDSVTGVRSLGDIGFGGRLHVQLPSQVIVDVTEKCNLSCTHCASAAFRRSGLYSGAMLSTELNTKLCEEVGQYGQGITRYLRYAASGEPLLHPQIDQMLADAVRTSGSLVTLTTNGTLLDDARIERLLATGIHLIDISIDAATSETYARVRLNGSLEVTRANALRLLERKERSSSKLVVAVSFVEQPANAHETRDFEDFWRGHGVDHVVIRRLHSNAGANQAVATQMHAENLRFIRRPCLYPWERVVLNSRGHIGFCPADWTHRASIADYHSTTIRDIWQGEFLQGLRKAHCDNDFRDPAYALCSQCPDWVSTRWPKEGRSYADMVSELGDEDRTSD
jgi:wyosine [tRNA(Phe)-imidazoG37] synthetase (radical SAM superfamily)